MATKIKPGQLVKGPGGKGLVDAALAQEWAKAKILRAALQGYQRGSAEAEALKRQLKKVAENICDLLKL